MNVRVAEAATLAEVGAVLRASVLPPVLVRLPEDLARRAVAAWEREDTVPLVDPEPLGDRRVRHLAGTLALIGLAISERGDWTGDEVVVPLPVELAGVAMDSADG
ncbi:MULTISPECIES: hypothetical protein [Amycolatopsis]|nr:hypothetical protein [Amycolatopsis sacchari]